MIITVTEKHFISRYEKICLSVIISRIFTYKDDKQYCTIYVRTSSKRSNSKTYARTGTRTLSNKSAFLGIFDRTRGIGTSIRTYFLISIDQFGEDAYLRAYVRINLLYILRWQFRKIIKNTLNYEHTYVRPIVYVSKVLRTFQNETCFIFPPRIRVKTLDFCPYSHKHT